MLPTVQTPNAPEDVAGRRIDAPDDSTIDGDPPFGTTGRELPPHLVRKLAPERKALNDPVSRLIVQLLCLHPEIDRDYPYVNLTTMTTAARRHMLRSISQRLGIPPAD